MGPAEELESLLQRMIAAPHTRRLFLASLPTLFAACASKKQTRYREGQGSDKYVNMSVADEQRMTQEVLPEIQKDYPPVDNPELQGYVSAVGRKLVTANALESHPYHYTFTVVARPSINAFALPAGTVFVTAPLVAMVDTEAELAGVLGHEIGHVKARHAAARLEQEKKQQQNSIFGAIGGGLLGGAAGFGVGKLACKKGDNACVGVAAGLGAAAGAVGGFLIAKYAFMANTKEDEMEADRIAFRTAVGAGYDKVQVGAFYSKLERMDEAYKTTKAPLMAGAGDVIATHPPSRERVAQMTEMANSTAPQPRPVVTTKEFDKAKYQARIWAAQHGAG